LRDPRWWLGVAVIGASLYADGASTCNGFRRGLREGSFIGAGSTSCGQTAGILSVGFGIYTALHFLNYRYTVDGTSRAWDAAGLVTVPAIACAFHCRAAIHNYGLPNGPTLAPASVGAH
jgi:hypothetical protein